MLKLVIIDDELLVLKHLSTMIEWSSLGYELAGAFDNGNEALEFLDSSTVDLILTDIKMPNVSGFDIAEYCIKKGMSTKVIFISAYRDFEYAQNGIRIGVIDYILKPVTKAKIIRALSSAYEILKKDKFINLKATDVVFPQKEEIENIQDLVENLMSGMITTREELEQTLIKKGLNKDISISKCIMFDGYIQNYEIYTTSIWKHDIQKLFYTINSIIFNIQIGIIFSIVFQRNNMIKIIGFCTDKAIIPDWNECVEKIMNYLNCLLLLDLKCDNISGNDCMYNIIMQENTGVANDYLSKNKIVREVYEYVKKNYKKNISLNDVSNFVSLSRTYFCVYYKQYAGETFIHTLTSYRIQKAKEIIKNGQLDKISILYSMVGFSNNGHFYKTFKTYTGMTPSEYSEMIRGQDGHI